MTFSIILVLLANNFLLEERTLNFNTLIIKHSKKIYQLARLMSGISILWLVVFTYYLMTAAKFDSPISILYITALALPSWLTTVLYSLWGRSMKLTEAEAKASIHTPSEVLCHDHAAV